MPEIHRSSSCAPVPAGDAELTSGFAQTAWHAREIEDVFRDLDSSPRGLSPGEAADRLARFGPNRLPTTAKQSWTKRLLLQFHNLLIYVLLGAALLSAVLGHLVDSAVILAVVLLNAAIGFIQEGRAERALEAIRGMIDPKASVQREERRRTVPAAEVVPGDVVLLEAGDRVPADLRLFRARNLRIEEAVLTGESVAVEKATAPVDAAAPLGDRTSMAYSGTFVAAGQGAGVVVGTGRNTELGHISTLLGQVTTLKTPLLRQMDGFARQLTLVILGVSALAFLFAVLVRDYALGEAFMVVVGLAVAAVPEGLPAIMSITLAIGVQRMAARNAIIRRLPAVETLGAVSVICSDKTGTLTRNEMTVREIITADASFAVEGVGYAPDGAVLLDGHPVKRSASRPLAELTRAALLCNNAELRRVEDQWRIDGDPMEGALVTLAYKAGLDPAAVRREHPRSDEIPFDAAHRFMATLHHTFEDGSFVLIKGAPERVLSMCSRQLHADGSETAINPDEWRRRSERLAASGHRVLAFARKSIATDAATLSFADVEDGAVLLGMTGFLDPPREEAVAAVADCRSAGIRVVMITGDHAVTAREIARQLGLADDPTVLSGPDLEGLDALQLRQAVRETTVFARAAPEHKLRLVEALQANGMTVAMTGDGVNDAPALKRADVGVAMGEKGTEVAKEAAEMVLADDNFASIVAAVREGRTVYDNLVKVIAWTLPTNGGEAMTILLAIAFGLALPITPLQVLWINMVTAVALGLTLGFEPTEPGTMRRPPRPQSGTFLTGELIWRIAFVSALFVIAAFGMFYWAESRGLPIEAARTIVVNTIVVMEIFYLFSVRYVHGTSLTLRGVVGTPAVLTGVGIVVVAQLALTYLPALQIIFETRPIAVLDGLLVIATGALLFIIVELEKRVRRKSTGRAR